MGVGDVQDAQGFRARREDRDVEPAQGEPVTLDDRGIADRGDADGGGDRD
jgi:hypothetical protein